MKPAWENPIEGPKRRWRNTVFYALNGLIAIHFTPRRGHNVVDVVGNYEADEEYFQVIAPQELKKRIQEIRRSAQRLKWLAFNRADWQYANQLMKLVDMLEDTYKEAVRMGDPFDPRVAAWVRRHASRGSVMIDGRKVKFIPHESVRIRLRESAKPSPSKEPTHGRSD